MVMLPVPFPAPDARPLILAHYMPWFQAPPTNKEFGWHWTMGKLDATKQAATHFHPLMGLYDSSDPAAVECHVQLMKLSGIDGALVDWYGNVDQWDYLSNHHNTQLVLDTLKRANLKFGLVYEDQTVPQIVKGGKFSEADAVTEGRKLMEWLDGNWFTQPEYLKLDGRPLLLVFGPQYYKEQDWPKMLDGLKSKPLLYTLHNRRSTAYSAYDWPLPQEGAAASEVKRKDFFVRSKDWPNPIPVAFPRFKDYYTAAGLGYGYPEIPDADGKTFRVSLQDALAAKKPFVQLATWNDWGEGTQIEPSVEFGYRDLEEIQRQRRAQGDFPYDARDLRLPIEIYKLRKQLAGRPGKLQKLKWASDYLLAGQVSKAHNLVTSLGLK